MPGIQYLQNVSGRVIKLIPPFKAIIAIDPYEGSAGGQRALLWSNKLTVDGKTNLINEDISKYLSINSKVVFTCHSLDETLQDSCPWFIAAARRQDACDMPIDDNFHFGIVNGQGYPVEFAPRRGILECKLSNGKLVQVLFQASNVFLYGKRKTKQPLHEFMCHERYAFDAIPVIPFENEYYCSWFATVVWKGSKPLCPYDDENQSDENIPVAVVPGVKAPALLAEIKSIAYNPRGLFWRGYGIIAKIFDDEFGLILGRRKPNRHESILFHRNFVTIFKNRMTNKDLNRFLKKGYRVQFVAVPSPKNLMVQWIASHVTIDEDGHLHDEVNIMG